MALCARSINTRPTLVLLEMEGADTGGEALVDLREDVVFDFVYLE
jgi:hypothetical protein